MKSEKICISKKNLVISLLVVLLLGLVGVSYMVQRNLTIRSKADEMESRIYDNCGLALDSLLKPLIVSGDYEKFKNDYFDLFAHSREKVVSTDPCTFGQTYPFATTTDKGYYVVPRNCCLNDKAVSGRPVSEALRALGIEYNNIDSVSPFKKVSEADRNAAITVGNQNENPTRCIDFGDDCDKCGEKYLTAGFESAEKCKEKCEKGPDDILPWVQPHMTFLCGQGDSAYRYDEVCSDGKLVKKVRVECGDPPGTTANRSCTFNCLNTDGKTWDRCENVPCQAVPTPTVVVLPTTPKLKGCADPKTHECYSLEEELVSSRIVNKKVATKFRGDKEVSYVGNPLSFEDCTKIGYKNVVVTGICAKQ